VIGLTGGLGSGKSTVLQMLRRKGAFTLDADKIVHGLLKKSAVQVKIKRAFGKDVFKGRSLDRRKMADVVFRSDAKRKTLEKILHPLVRQQMARALSKKRSTVAVCDIPLLFEKGWGKKFDKVVVVFASMPQRRRRLLRRGFSDADIKARMKAQWPLKKKVSRADFVVMNDGTKKQTKHQVDEIWDFIRRIHGLTRK